MAESSQDKKYVQLDILGELYAGNATKVGKFGFPQLKPQQNIPVGEFRSFNYLLSLDNPENYWIHCFCHDYQFERLWTGFDFYIHYILNTKGFISVDYSLYRDYSEVRLVWNCYRNRVIDYAIQEKNGIMIPSAVFGPENTWSWCFDGLPHNSTVAITTNGILNDAEARRLFVGGVDAMVNTIYPSAIVICGNYPNWLESKYPSIEIIGIPNFSQQRKRRCA